MLEKLKKSEKFPLIIGMGITILVIIVVILAVVVGINIKKLKQTNADIDTGELKNNTDGEIEENDSPIIIDQVIDEEDEEEKEQDQENSKEETQKEETQKVDPKYFIRVNYKANVVTIYTKDTNGQYTIPYKAMVCSTGIATPKSGTYTMPSGSYSRGTWGMMIGNVWAQYFTRIKGSILFHSVPYTERNKWSLEYWEYDKLGTSASAGCVRLTVENAKWIYDNCPAGTKVEFYADSNPGPLQPAQPAKISEHEQVRGWDPTDPDKTNPWKTYVIQKEEPDDIIQDENEPTQTPDNNEQNPDLTEPNPDVNGPDSDPNDKNQDENIPDSNEDDKEQDGNTPGGEQEDKKQDENTSGENQDDKNKDEDIPKSNQDENEKPNIEEDAGTIKP